MVSRRRFQTARFRGKPYPIVKRSHGSKVLILTTSKELMMATPDVLITCSSYPSVLFLKKDYWVVCDRINASGTARLDVNFHFSSDSEPSANGQPNSEIRIVEHKKSDLELVGFFGSPGDWKQEESFVSNCYAQKSPSTTWVFSTAVDSGETTLVSPLLPYSDLPINAQRIEAKGGLAL